MSTSISLVHKQNGSNFGIGWNNNPYGLLAWAKENYSLYAGLSEIETDAEDLLSRGLDNNDDRVSFWQLLVKYNRVLEWRETFFFFDIASYIQGIEPYLAIMPMEYQPYMRIQGVQFAFNMAAIPVNHFLSCPFNVAPPCTNLNLYYKQWLDELIRIAFRIAKNQYHVFISK